MLSLWCVHESIPVSLLDDLEESLYKQKWLVSPTLLTSMVPLLTWLVKHRITYNVVMPIPKKWSYEYLKNHNPKLHDELLCLLDKASEIYEPHPFSWVTNVSYFTDKADYTYQRYMAVKRMSRMDKMMFIVTNSSSLEEQKLASAGRIIRMRNHEHPSQSVRIIKSPELVEMSDI